MKYDIDDELIVYLKEKLDALIEEGNKLTKGLSVDEQYSLIKRVIFEGIETALQNIKKDGESKFTEEELIERKKELEQFIREYYEKKFSEKLAEDWVKRR